MRAPAGFRLAGARAGLKSSSGALDLVLIAADEPVTAAGVYTSNEIVAAPVRWCRARTPGTVRGVVANSGNANACTGAAGEADCAEMATLAAAALGGARAEEMLVLSTGIIGEPLPMPRLRAALPEMGAGLGADAASIERAARGLMTTDSHPKIASAEVAGGEARVLGLAKGAAMIAPNLATMLAVIMTDAALPPDAAQALLRETVATSFNAIRVDGHASTNDTVLLLASGRRAATPEAVADAIGTVATTLARSIPADGEGASHLVTVEVTGAATTEAARAVAQAIADSPLVKTAVHGADPNWGRILSAAGMAGAGIREADASLSVAGVEVFRGGPLLFDAAALSARMRAAAEVVLALDLGAGTSAARCWTCDLTPEYVRLNAEYHT